MTSQLSTTSRRLFIHALAKLAIADFSEFYRFAKLTWPEIVGSLRTDSPNALADSVVSTLVSHGLVREALAALDSQYKLDDLRVLREELGDPPKFAHQDPSELHAYVEACIENELFEPFLVASLRGDREIAALVAVDYARDPKEWLRESARRANSTESPALLNRWRAWAAEANRKREEARKGQREEARKRLIPERAPAFAGEPEWVRESTVAPTQTLRSFLLSAFEGPELHSLLRRTPALASLAPELPGRNSALVEIVDKLVMLIQRDHRMLDLKAALLQERPGRATDIAALTPE